MKETQEIKKIVATFIKTGPEAISDDTVIDRTAVKGSIMIHRMYAAISRALGREVRNYHNIKTFGELLNACATGSATEALAVPGTAALRTPAPARVDAGSLPPRAHKRLSVGIDMESVDRMPGGVDFRKDAFYAQNFSPEEIEYCLKQADPRQSFAGKFAAKEAVVKADNSYRGAPFRELAILNDGLGQPYFRDIAISISHADKYAIAIAIRYP